MMAVLLYYTKSTNFASVQTVIPQNFYHNFYVPHKSDLYLHPIFMFLSYYSFIQCLIKSDKRAQKGKPAPSHRLFSALNNQEIATAHTERSKDISKK